MTAAWEPIDTAPEDGTPVDLWCQAPGLSAGPARVPDCWFSGGFWWRYDDSPSGDDQCRARVHDATHWMPLPSPPSPVTDATAIISNALGTASQNIAITDVQEFDASAFAGVANWDQDPSTGSADLSEPAPLIGNMYRVDESKTDE